MSSEDEESFKFEIDEIVWAKVRGFPWWPAKVSRWIAKQKLPSDNFQIFICPNVHTDINIHDLTR